MMYGNFRRSSVLCFLLILALATVDAFAQASTKGAFIFISKKGDVHFENQAGEKMPDVGQGKTIPNNYIIITGKDGQLVGLLSNGTLLTLEPQTRMRVLTFEQEPFKDEGRKLSDLEGEPSKSKVDVKLDVGSLIIKTKKLKKSSVFNIYSPVGAAGIRGTEFQMASLASGGVQLDVTESTVAFTPASGGGPIAVSQGNGLTVPSSGIPQRRPLNPVVARKIAASNKKATEATQDVPLVEVSEAMEQASKEQEGQAEEQPRDEPKEETPEEESNEEEAQQVEETEQVEEADAVEDTAPAEEPEPLEESAPVEEPVLLDDPELLEEPEAVENEQPTPLGELQSDEEIEAQLRALDEPEEKLFFEEQEMEEPAALVQLFDDIMEDEEEKPTKLAQKKVGRSNTEQEISSVEQPENISQPLPRATVEEPLLPLVSAEMESTNVVSPVPPSNEAVAPLKPASPVRARASASPVQSSNQQLIAQALENNPELKLRQEVSMLDLSETQVDRFAMLEPALKSIVKNESEDVVGRLLSNPAFEPAKVESFYGYSDSTRELMLGLDDSALFGLMEAGFEDAILNEALSINLNREQIERYDQLPRAAQDGVRLESPAVVTRLFESASFEPARVATFYGYSDETRELVLGLEDEIMFSLLDEQFDEELFNESLTKMNIDFSSPVNMPPAQTQDPNAQRLHELSDRLKESGNGWVMDELLDMSGGQLTDEWLRVGETAEVLLRHSSIGEMTPAEVFQPSEVLSNPFYMDVASMFDELELEALVYGDGVMIGASHLIIPDNSLALNPYFGDGVREVVVSASESISFEGNLDWDAPLGTNGARLVVMSAGDLNIKQGATLQSATSDLILSTREDLVLEQVNLNAAREVVIRGMRDVTLNNVHIGASNLAKIKARRDLNADGLTFRTDINKIVMEATTLRLRNTAFPAAAQVRLNSSLGGIDGRYPNFGSVPAAQQIGRVNFIENVKSGTNLLDSRAAFDQHGGNIQIGKTPNP